MGEGALREEAVTGKDTHTQARTQTPTQSDRPPPPQVTRQRTGAPGGGGGPGPATPSKGTAGMPPLRIPTAANGAGPYPI